MNVLLIGSGGREHALAWALSASPSLTRLYAAPGNPGIAQLAICVDVAIDDHAGLIALCRDKMIDLVVVGPEAPLVAGLVDELQAAGVLAFGPGRAAAQLEGSKGFTKDLCREAGIPTAAYGRFSDKSAALAYLRNCAMPIVVKADGLAAGKLPVEFVDAPGVADGGLSFRACRIDPALAQLLDGAKGCQFLRALGDGCADKRDLPFQQGDFVALVAQLLLAAQRPVQDFDLARRVDIGAGFRAREIDAATAKLLFGAHHGQRIAARRDGRIDQRHLPR